MRGIVGFTLILTAFWMINSGYFKPVLLGLGAISVLAVIILTTRMKNKDGESFPLIMPTWRLPGYLLWMIGQIIAANIDVTRRVWLGPSSISPVIFTIPANQKSEVAKVLYANSITMTPGTITLAVHDKTLEIHALTKAAAKDLKKGEMGRRIMALEAI